MNDRPENDDLLIDACLDEVLGERTPPDLTERILATLEERRRSASASESDSVWDASKSTVDMPIEVVTPQTPVRPMGGPSRDWSRLLLTVSLALIVCLSVFVAVYRGGDQLANVPQERTPNAPRRLPMSNDSRPNDFGPSDLGPNSSEPSESGSQNIFAAEAPSETKPPVPPPTNSAAPSEIVNSVDPTDERSQQPSDENEFVPESQVVKLDDVEIVALINERLDARWREAEITPASAIDDSDWCVRVHEALVARTPTSSEIARFVRQPDAMKRAKLVDQLLGEASAASFGATWADRIDDWLLPSSPTGLSLTQKNGWDKLNTGLRTHLAESLAANQHYDDLIRDLITAQGSNDTQRDDYNVATNYVLALIDDNRAHVTSHINRALLGQQAQCAQCHDDARTGWTQHRFWQVASVFNTIDVDFYRPGTGRLSDQGAFEAEARYQDPQGQWKTAMSSFLDSSDDTRTLRSRYADHLLASPKFAEAAMNRLWAELLEYGFTLPVDDVGEHNQPSHPELLEALSEQLAAHDFDLRRAIRWIVLSNAFNRSSATPRGTTDFPGTGAVALFSRSYYRSPIYSEAEAGLRFLAGGGRAQLTDPDSADPEILLSIRRGEVSHPVPDVSTSPPRTGQLLSPAYLKSIQALGKSKLPPEELLNHLVMLIHARPASDSELELAEAIFDATKDRTEALKQIAWALLNSNP